MIAPLSHSHSVMRTLLVLFLLALFSAGALAQDKLTLTNGDVLTGTIKTMGDGKITITSPVLGDITVPIADVSNMTTQAGVELMTKTGDRFVQRRILGIEGGSLKLEGAEPRVLALDNLDRINPPAVIEATWAGTFKLNALYIDGNTDRRSAGSSFDASRRSKTDRVQADASFYYSEDKNQTTGQWVLNDRHAEGGIKYDYFLSDRWYLWTTVRALGDTLADIELRFTAATGLGYTLIEDKTTLFVLEAGVAYVSEEYRSNSPSSDYAAVRFAYKYNKTISDRTKLLHSVEVLESVKNQDDVLVHGKTEIVTSLSKSMLASLGWIIDYDNTPAPLAKERVDNRVELSIGWSF
jgi:putative salt-induced outer membrane protein YdiY